MPNPTPAVYTVQIGPTYSVETAAELTGWANLQQRSVSDVTREATERGLALLREEWREAYGVIPHSVLTRATEDVAAGGRRRASASRRRTWRASRASRAGVARQQPDHPTDRSRRTMKDPRPEGGRGS
jgi:hypothetical protein